LPSKRLRPVRLAAGASASQSASDRSTPPDARSRCARDSRSRRSCPRRFHAPPGESGSRGRPGFAVEVSSAAPPRRREGS
jgi:hypothetical protein